LSEEFKATNQLKITSEGKEFTLTAEHVGFREETKTSMEQKYIPHVIEPSFGIGRIVYCIFEHCFKTREKDAQRTYFDFPAAIAPLKCSLLPLMNNADMNKKVQEIKKLLIRHGVSSKVDDSGQTVGKRYARTDECGIPFAITVDFETLQDETVTLRELDSMKQVRLPIVDVAATVNTLIAGHSKWSEVVAKYGLFESTQKDE
jgi:glycyl-tRNA synthetase